MWKCPICEFFNYPTEIFCYQCDTTRPIKATTPIGCPTCSEPMAWHTVECETCNTIVPPFFWDHVEEGLEDNLIDDLIRRNSDENILDYFWGHAMVCCDRLPEVCTCEFPISGEDIKDIDTTEVYDNHALPVRCLDCWHYGEKTCLPLREKLRTQSQALLEPCEQFQFDVDPGLKMPPIPSNDF